MSESSAAANLDERKSRPCLTGKEVRQTGKKEKQKKKKQAQPGLQRQYVGYGTAPIENEIFFYSENGFGEG